MSDALDKAAEKALQPTWEILITCRGQQVQLQWSQVLHVEAIPMILVDQAKQLLEAQFVQRRKEAPLVQVPGMILKPGNGGR